MEQNNEPAIGIDLGTTYSCVGLWQNGKVEIVANADGKTTTPSIVTFWNDVHLVGDAALNKANVNPSNTVYDVKRLIGRTYDDEHVQKDKSIWSFKVIDVEGRPEIEVKFKNETKVFKPQQISAFVLIKLKEEVEKFLGPGSQVKKAVITVPAYFGESQKMATADAAALAGLEVLRIITEPVAAAICYGMDRTDQSKKNILIFDLGGGTFDVSILELNGKDFSVKAVNGDAHLGGEDFDAKLLDFCIDDFKEQTGIDLRDAKKARPMRRLKTQCEKTKRILSSATEDTISMDELCDGEDYNAAITRAFFEQQCHSLFEACIKHVEKALELAKMQTTDIDEVVLCGGSTRIPKVKDMLKAFFNGKELNDSINPDEAVAQGATLMAAISTGAQSQECYDMICVEEVNSLSLGIETSGEVMYTMIPLNTQMPFSKTDDFFNAADNQVRARIKVFEGERELTKYNHKIGEFVLQIPKDKAGKVQVTITYALDEVGILQVTAVCKRGQTTEQITIEDNSARLNPAQIAAMIEDSREFHDADRAERERIEYGVLIKNKLDIMKSNKKHPFLSDQDQALFLPIINEGFKWLTENKDGPPEAFLAKLKSLKQPFNQMMGQIDPEQCTQ